MQQAACSAVLALGAKQRLPLHRPCLLCTKTFARGALAGASARPDFPGACVSSFSALATPAVPLCNLWVHVAMGQGL